MINEEASAHTEILNHFKREYMTLLVKHLCRNEHLYERKYHTKMK